MTQAQQNRLTMNKAVLALLDDASNKDTWKDLPAFVRAHDELKASVEARDESVGTQAVTSTGTTLDKEQDQEAAISKVLAVARPTAAYALEQRNNTLHGKMDKSKSYLSYLPDNELAAELQVMIDEVSGLVNGKTNKLSDYSVDSDKVQQAQDAVDKIKQSQTAPRQVIDDHAAATKSIPQEEATARHALARMDKLIGIFTDTNSSFVSKYRQARIIVDTGGRKGGDASGSNPASSNI